MQEDKSAKDLTLVEAMNHFGLSKCPSRAKETDLWATAIVLVLKSNGKEYYAIQGTNANGNLVITKDIEGDHAIVRIVTVYPVLKMKPEINGKPMSKANRGDKEYLLQSMPYHFVDKLHLGEKTDEEIDDLVIRSIRLHEYEYARAENLGKTGGRK